MRIKIAGLGFGEKNAITLETIETIKSSENVILRTKEHPSVAILNEMGIKYTTCDDLYNSCDSFEELYEKIADRVIESAKKMDTVYVVPGAPSILESTVDKLLNLYDDIEIIEAISFIEPCVTASKVNVADGLTMIDAVELKLYNINPNFNLLITQLWNEFIISEAKIELTNIYGDYYEVIAIYSAGLKSEEKRIKLKIYEMDRVLTPDIRLSIMIPKKPNSNFQELLSKTYEKNLNVTSEMFIEDEDLAKLTQNLINNYRNLKDQMYELGVVENEILNYLSQL